LLRHPARPGRTAGLPRRRGGAGAGGCRHPAGRGAAARPLIDRSSPPTHQGAGMAHGDITHIDIPVSDMGRATEFYGSLFGWQIAEIEGFEGYPMWQAPNQVSGGGLAPRSEDFSQPRSYV